MNRALSLQMELTLQIDGNSSKEPSLIKIDFFFNCKEQFSKKQTLSKRKSLYLKNLLVYKYL